MGRREGCGAGEAGADEALERVPGNYAGSAVEASLATMYLPDLRMSTFSRSQTGDRAGIMPTLGRVLVVVV